MVTQSENKPQIENKILLQELIEEDNNEKLIIENEIDK